MKSNNNYKKYVLDSTTLVHKCSQSYKILPDNFYISKIGLLNKRPLNPVRDKIALQLLNKSNLVIYANSLIPRLEIYCKLPSDNRIICSRYTDADNTFTEITENILMSYIKENKLVDEGISNEYSLLYEIRDTLNSYLFNLGYLYHQFDKHQSIHTDYDYNVEDFDWDDQYLNNQCYYVVSENPLPSLEEFLQKDYINNYIYTEKIDFSDSYNYLSVRDFYKHVSLSLEEKDLFRSGVFYELAVQAFLNIALNVIYIRLGMCESNRNNIYDFIL